MRTAAFNAGEYLRRSAFSEGTIEWKKKDDPVTKHDRKAEEIIIETLEALAPAKYVGEEGGVRECNEKGDSDYTYYIDPIDGTKSFILRDFDTSISIALEEESYRYGMLTARLISSVVYDFMRQIMYTGDGKEESFKGSILFNRGFAPESKKLEGNSWIERPFRKHHPLSRTRVSIDNDSGLYNAFKDRPEFSVTQKSGSIALSMAQLATRNLDAMVCASIGKGNVWDVAAGYHLLSNGRFSVLDYDLDLFDYKRAQNGLIAIADDKYDEVMAVIEEYRK
jgi:myo-inositol-1(or 4)-monophosphatase